MSPLDEIAAERARQIAKGWTPEHDDGHDDQSIAMAAACYAAPLPIGTCIEYTEHGRPPRINSAWPWPSPRKIPHDRMGSTVSRRDELVIAGALILAEIERLDRAAEGGADEDAAYEHMEAVSALVQQGWDADECMFDEVRIRWLEEQARKSTTGISFDWVPSVEGERSGFRFMRRFFIGEQCTTLRAAIDRAMKDEPQHKSDRPERPSRTGPTGQMEYPDSTS